ncbi:DUF3138 family protein, partial [Paraburkholderia sediminicola]|uniref:DUF3138 family protein n=1 Tax=Paraburkholderia sediminicola TaxID=458836 RepID=UPI0038BADE6A
MRKKLICLLVAGSLPGFAMADTTSDQIKALQAQLNALQKEVKQLRSEAATRPKAAAAAAAPVGAPGSAVAAA